MNKILMADFLEDEIKEVVLQMNGLGALGPDGFLAYFFYRKISTLRVKMSVNLCLMFVIFESLLKRLITLSSPSYLKLKMQEGLVTLG